MNFNCHKDKKSKENLDKMVRFLKIIAEPNRLKILCLLQKREMCVCEIWNYLNLRQNLTSYHLKILEDFKLIDSRREGLKVFYSINKKEISKYTNLLNHYLKSYGN